MPLGLCGLPAEIFEIERVLNPSAVSSEFDEQWQQQLFECIPHMVWMTDADGSCCYLNRRGAQQIGLPSEAAYGWEWLRLLHPDDVNRTSTVWQQSVQSGAPYRTEYRVRQADGSYRWYLSQGLPIRLPNGRIEKWVGTWTDIDDLKNIEAALRESEERYRTLINCIPVPLFVYDRETLAYLAVNDAAVAEYGYSREEFLRMKLTDIRPPEDVPALLEMLSKSKQEYEQRGVWRHRKKDGSIIDVEIFAHAVELDNRSASIGLAYDVTDRKRAEIERNRLNSLIEASPDFIGIADHEQRVIFVNRAGQKLLGLTSPVTETRIPDYLADEDYARFVRELIPAVEHDGAWTGEFSFRHFESGAKIPIQLTFFTLPRATQEATPYYACVARDISAQKQAEDELRRTTELLKAVANGTPDALFVKDLQGRYLLFNPAAANFVGRSVEEVIGRDDTELFSPDDARFIMSRDRQVIATGQIETDEEELTAAGVTRTYLATKAPYHNGQGEIAGVIGISRDITDRKQAERELQLRDRAIQAVTQGILITDPGHPNNPIIYASPGFTRLTGYTAEEVVGRNCRFLQGKDTDPAAVAQVREAIREARPCKVELLNYRKDGSAFWNELTISPVADCEGRLTHFVGTQTDVTRRRELEDQYRQSQKMEAIGQLAGGIAHDFNNLMTIIIGYSDMMGDQLTEERALENLQEIRKAGERAASLTRQLLAFGRKQVLTLEKLDLNEVVRDTQKMLRRIIGEDIELVTLFVPRLKLVEADPGQLEQVLVNLAVNARDAMPQGGKLTIETRNEVLDMDFANTCPGVKSGQYVMLSISDTGTGMSDEVKRHIFEPFFTTKGPGKGTGLGLPVVHGVVKQSGGHIEVESEAGTGTTFRIYLPVADDTCRLRQPAERSKSIPRGVEKILLVEDEPAVRRLWRHSLESCGYTVLEAANGSEALNLCENELSQIDLLITDVVMPLMSGRELAERLLLLRPETKVLYVSGYTDDSVMRHGIAQDEVAFLAKPFSSISLAQKVRELLDAPLACGKAESDAEIVGIN
jgi:two-component system, cell cycle sensor histidine kinase and response regulator CckA